MAKLVKFNTEPQKYYAERQQFIWPLNQIITREDAELKNNFFEHNQVFLKKITDIINNYLQKTTSERSKAHQRGSIIKRQRHTAELLSLAVLWQQNIALESVAILKLARVMAQEILNTNINSNAYEDIDIYIKKYLNKFFNIKLYLPAEVLVNLEKIRFIKYLNSNDRIKLKIFLNNKHYEFICDGLDMRRVVSRVKAVLKQQEYARNIKII